ncbi:Na/Pi cotransporter family protein [bacterium]|nr:Na/Pi cotransporter family protein [bacterium]
METFSWAMLIGGLAFFFFGLQNARQGLQLIAGDRLRRVMSHLTGNRFMATGIGGLVTLILQSSSATTVMLVSFAATGLLTLKQAFGVILGADIGTTFVVVLLSIQKITEYALLIVALGFFMEWLSKRKRTQYLGSIILGFGLVFYGMHLMSASMIPLRESESARVVFQFLGEHPFYNLLIATIFTAIIQTSAATIGMAIALSFTGAITFEAAVPIILGANVGTCITAMLSSFGMGIDGRRVAIAHVMVKIVGVAIAFPFIPQIVLFINKFWIYFTDFIPKLANDVSGKIAVTHLLFNVAIAIFFLPFVDMGVFLVKKIIPRPLDDGQTFGPKYLDERALETPSYALGLVKREIIRIAELVHGSFEKSITIFERREELTAIIENVESQDDKVDILDKAVRFYLAKLSQEKLSKEQSNLQLSLLFISTDLEDIGDIMSKDLVTLAGKKKKRGCIFSEQGWVDLRAMHKMVGENFKIALSMLVSPGEELVTTLRRHEKYMLQVEQDLRQAHLERLHKGIQDAFDTSSIHLDILGNYRRINTKLTHIAEAAYDIA